MTGNSWCGSLVLFCLWCKFFTHCHIFPLNNLDRHPYLCVSNLSSCCQHLLDLPVECDRPKIAPTHTCAIHQNNWRQHAIRYGRQSFLGIHQLIRCSEEECVEWLPQRNQQVQQHLSYITQMTRTTKFAYKKGSHGQKRKIRIFKRPWPSNSPEIVQHTFRHCTLIVP